MPRARHHPRCTFGRAGRSTLGAPARGRRRPPPRRFLPRGCFHHRQAARRQRVRPRRWPRARGRLQPRDSLRLRGESLHRLPHRVVPDAATLPLDQPRRDERGPRLRRVSRRPSRLRHRGQRNVRDMPFWQEERESDSGGRSRNRAGGFRRPQSPQATCISARGVFAWPVDVPARNSHAGRRRMRDLPPQALRHEVHERQAGRRNARALLLRGVP